MAAVQALQPDTLPASAAIQALLPDTLPVESKPLDVPPYEDVAAAIKAGLVSNFETADVSVVECPDLTQQPWRLAAPGLGGSPRLLDIGGVPYLVPTPTKEKLYDMKDYPALTEGKEGLIIGAGAAPCTFLNRNAEMVPNLYVREDKTVVQETRICRTHDHDGSHEVIKLPESETGNSLLGNLFLSEGKPGQVLKITCKKRTGDKNFVTCIREALVAAFPDKSIGLGGVFNIVTGKVKIHVMPDFSPCPLNTDDDVAKWLKFYEVPAPFTVTSFLVANDPGLDLRVEHSHGWSESGGTGGHYHYDTTPEEVEYIGYYNIGRTCYRVDRPQVTHQVGRD